MTRYLTFAVLSLALVGCDAMTAHTGVTARVGQHELTTDEMVELLAGNPQIPAQTEVVRTVANLWVDYTILTEMLAEDSTLSELDLTAMVDPYVEQRTFQQLREQVMTADTLIAEDELRSRFQEQAPGLRVRARHILLTYPEGSDDAARDSVRALADELQQRAASGEDFAALAREYSQDPGNAQSGGDLGWFGRDRMVKPFEEAAFALQPGEVSDAVETPFGLHIIKMEERETPEWSDERAEQFRRSLVMERRQGSLSEYVDSLREPVNIEVESGAADVARNLAESPGERLGGRAGSRELVTWQGGALTAGELVGVLRRLPPQQQAQWAALQDEQMENLLTELATNELVLADAGERGLSVPETEQDSIRGVIREQLLTMAQSAGLTGAPQEGESEAEAVDRHVRTLLEDVLAGQANLLPLGALPYVMRDQAEWQVYPSTFPEVVEELETRRGAEGQPQPMPMPPTGQGQPPAGQGQPPAGQAPPAQPVAPDTGG
jgi:hypothetical protein